MWSDKESDKDYLNFGEVSQIAVNILTSQEMLPVSLGIFGNWGAGKSSLLKLIEHDLRKRHPDWLIINFDAWLYQGYDDARAALLEIIARELNKTAEDDKGLFQKTKNLLKRVNSVRALGLLAEGTALAFGVPTGGLISRGIGAVDCMLDGVQKDEYQQIEDVTNDAINKTEELVKPAVKLTPPEQIDAFRQEYGEILKEIGKPLVVIIDNLDRCLPINAIHTLESIRLFLFMPNTAFVIAADEEMIRAAVSEYFRGSSERHQIDYLDKLIQIPIRVPKAGILEIRSYLFMLYAIEHGVTSKELDKLRDHLEICLQQSWKNEPILKDEALKLTGKDPDSKLAHAFDLADRIAPILAASPFIYGNPRIVKRLLNVVKMRTQIALRRGIPLDESVITKLVIFERCAGSEATSDLYKLIDAKSGKPELLRQLESTKPDTPLTPPESWTKNSTIKEFVLEWAKLEPSLKDMDLRPAIYLSRETMPIGSYVAGLSAKGKEALKVLISTSKTSSLMGLQIANGVSGEEEIIMEELVKHLRLTPDWSNQPKGFAGAILIAERSPEAAKVFSRFIKGLGNQKPWMKAMLKNKIWFKES